MTNLAVQAVDTTLAIETPAPTQLVAHIDPPAVLEVAPIGATLAVRAVQSGVLTAPAEQGPAGPTGPSGRDGAGTTTPFAFPQPETAWTLAHNLNRYPSVTLVDSSGDMVAADVAYLDANTIAIAFGFATAGIAYLN